MNLKDNIKLKPYLLLYGNLLIYSFSTVCSKMASGYPFLSLGFIVFYGLVLTSLMIYAVLWQQVLKRLPLSVAFANKSVTIIFGMLWGAIFFGEPIKINMLIGCAVIIAGVYLVVSEDDH